MNENGILKIIYDKQNIETVMGTNIDELMEKTKIEKNKILIIIQKLIHEGKIIDISKHGGQNAYHLSVECFSEHQNETERKQCIRFCQNLVEQYEKNCNEYVSEDIVLEGLTDMKNGQIKYLEDMKYVKLEKEIGQQRFVVAAQLTYSGYEFVHKHTDNI